MQLIFLFFIIGTMVMITEQLLTGGLSDTKPGDADAQAVADQVRNTVQSLIGRTFTQYAVESYRTQVVAGTNFYLKVYIQDTVGSQYVVHLRVFRPLRGDPALTGLMYPTMWNDPISFDGYTSLTS